MLDHSIFHPQHYSLQYKLDHMCMFHQQDHSLQYMLDHLCILMFRPHQYSLQYMLDHSIFHPLHYSLQYMLDHMCMFHPQDHSLQYMLDHMCMLMFRPHHYILQYLLHQWIGYVHCIGHCSVQDGSQLRHRQLAVVGVCRADRCLVVHPAFQGIHIMFSRLKTHL
jgi:hypothetical protein